MAATGKVIGTVTAVVGEAKATAADGTVRILQVGDQVHGDEVITTSAAGSINVALENGKTLDCGGDADLTLHEGILNVATAPAISAPASDVEALQRAIAAGQDPSQVAAATAAGGAPAAGGAEDGGAHTPVILEQSNAASVVSSGFATEGDSIAFATPQTQAFPGTVPASNSAPVVVITEAAPSASPAPVFESSNNVLQLSTPADDQPIAAASVPTVPAVVEVALEQGQSNNAPQVTVSNPQADASIPSQPEAPVTADAPVTVVADSSPQDSQPTTVVVTQPSDEAPAPGDEPTVVVVVQPSDEAPAPADEPTVVVVVDETPAPADEPIVVATNPETNDEGSNQPPVVTETSDPTPPVVVDGGPTSDEPETGTTGTTSLTYSITANTNQDEQLALLSFQNGDNEFQTLVFFGQEGQQKPTALSLAFDITEDSSTVKLQYIDAFAGNSDANTGHAAQKIAIKDFGLGIDGVQTVLAQENDGVNVGVGKSISLEGTVHVDMTTGSAGEWSFSNPAESSGIDILDVTGNSLDLGGLVDSALESIEVISLKGAGAQELTLSADDVLKVTDGENVLHIVGGKEDTLTLDDTWHVTDGDASAAGIQPSYFGWVQVTHDSGATLLVDPDVNIKGAMMG